MLDNLSRWIGQVTQAGIGLLALAIVLQILFNDVGFLGGNIIDTISTLVAFLADKGLVGLITAAVIYKLFS